MAFYFFWGQEEYDIENEVNKIRKEFLDETFAAMNYRYFDSPEYKELLNVLCTTGTMFGNIVNVVSCDKYIFDAKRGLTQEQIAQIEKHIEAPSDNVHTIFTLNIPRDKDYRDVQKVQSKPLCKLLIKNTQSKECKQYRTYEKELYNRIIKIGKEKKLVISTDVAEYFAKEIGVNLKNADAQLEKLQIAIYPDTKVTRDNINEFLSFGEDVNKIADYLLEQKKDMAVWEFHKCYENGHHFLEILWKLQKQISTCIGLKSDIETLSLSEAAIKNGLKEYPAKLLLQKIQNLSLNNLICMKKNLIKAEETIKKDYSLYGEFEIEKAILSDI